MLLDRIRSLANFIFDWTVYRLARGLQDCAVYVEVPAMITTADSTLLDPAILQ